MTDAELKGLLKEGKTVCEIVSGQRFDWPAELKGNEHLIVNFRDAISIDLMGTPGNELDDDDFDNIVCQFDTVGEILEEACYNTAFAYDLYLNMQYDHGEDISPAAEAESVRAATDDDEAKSCYGETWGGMDARAGRKQRCFEVFGAGRKFLVKAVGERQVSGYFLYQDGLPDPADITIKDMGSAEMYTKYDVAVPPCWQPY